MAKTKTPKRARKRSDTPHDPPGAVSVHHNPTSMAGQPAPSSSTVANLPAWLHHQERMFDAVLCSDVNSGATYGPARIWLPPDTMAAEGLGPGDLLAVTILSADGQPRPITHPGGGSWSTLKESGRHGTGDTRAQPTAPAEDSCNVGMWVAAGAVWPAAKLPRRSVRLSTPITDCLGRPPPHSSTRLYLLSPQPSLHPSSNRSLPQPTTWDPVRPITFPGQPSSPRGLPFQILPCTRLRLYWLQPAEIPQTQAPGRITATAERRSGASRASKRSSVSGQSPITSQSPTTSQHQGPVTSQCQSPSPVHGSRREDHPSETTLGVGGDHTRTPHFSDSIRTDVTAGRPSDVAAGWSAVEALLGGGNGPGKRLVETFLARWLGGRILAGGSLVFLPLCGTEHIFQAVPEADSSVGAPSAVPGVTLPARTRPSTSATPLEALTPPPVTPPALSPPRVMPLTFFRVEATTSVVLLSPQALQSGQSSDETGLEGTNRPKTTLVGMKTTDESTAGSGTKGRADGERKRLAEEGGKGQRDEELVGKAQDGVDEAAVAAAAAAQLGRVSFSELGGVSAQISALKEMVEIPLRQPELFRRYGIRPPRGVLLYGPPGTGKTLLARAAASESGASMFVINGPEVVSEYYGESEAALRSVFKAAERAAPSVIFIDELDAIAPAREAGSEDLTQRMVSALLTVLDGTGGSTDGNRVVVIGATNRPGAIDPALRRPGRFDRELEIGVPTPSGRLEILEALLRGVKHSLAPAEVRDLAKATHGFVGADLAALCNEAALNALRCYVQGLGCARREGKPSGREVMNSSQPDKSRGCLRGEVTQSDGSRGIWTADLRSSNEQEGTGSSLDSSPFGSYIGGRSEGAGAPELGTLDSVHDRSTCHTEANDSTCHTEAGISDRGSTVAGISGRGLSVEGSGSMSGCAANATSATTPWDGATTGPSGRAPSLGSKPGKATVVEGPESRCLTGDSSRQRGWSLGTECSAVGDPQTQECSTTTEFAKNEIQVKLTELNGAKEEVRVTGRRAEGTGGGSRPPLLVLASDFEAAKSRVRPSALREVAVEVPTVRWTDIGGQEDVKQRLREAVEWPQLHPEALRRVGARPPRGVLLYGPPGCSKTLMARAVATEAGLNFLAVKGPELFSKWVGESEKAVRALFARARASAPSVVFFDEIDGLAASRDDGGGSDGGTGLGERVMSQLLMEMDGLDPLTGVAVVAATNRPDIIDPALLRPGRFDRLLFVGPPSRAAREDIFRIHLGRTPMGSDVVLDALAVQTDGYTGADIAAVCREAAMAALEESMDSEEVCARHLQTALKVVRPSDPGLTMEYYQRFGRG